MNYTAQGIKIYLAKNTPLQQKRRQCITIDEENLFHFLNPLFIPKLTGTISNPKQLRATLMQHHCTSGKASPCTASSLCVSPGSKADRKKKKH